MSSAPCDMESIPAPPRGVVIALSACFGMLADRRLAPGVWAMPGQSTVVTLHEGADHYTFALSSMVAQSPYGLLTVIAGADGGSVVEVRPAHPALTAELRAVWAGLRPGLRVALGMPAED